MTRFKEGQQVRSEVNAQGLTKGKLYEVVNVETQFILGSGYTTYTVIPVMPAGEFTDEEFEVGNGHLVLSEV